MVFFSRFGVLSYPCIVLACVLFFFLFYFFLSKGKKIAEIIESSRILNVTIVFVSVVFCSSMFAGVKSLFSYFPTWLYFLLITLALVACFFVARKGIRGLEKTNLFLMPATSLLFLVVMIYAMRNSSNFEFDTSLNFAGLLFSPLYVALNTCMSGLVICKAGDGLSKKQTVLACLFSSILLLIFLFFGNFILQHNGESFFAEMPFLFLTSGNSVMFAIAFFVIFVGCFTTLISLCFTLKNSFDKVVQNETFSTLLAVFVPFSLSVLGFSQIVSFLYPICSVLGIGVLVFLGISTMVHKRN